MLSDLIKAKIAELPEQLENLTFGFWHISILLILILHTTNSIHIRAGKNPLNLCGFLYFSIGFWFFG
jgi:hypothetical protein